MICRDKLPYIENTNWNFSLEFLFLYSLICSAFPEMKNLPNWLKHADESPVKESNQ